MPLPVLYFTDVLPRKREDGKTEAQTRSSIAPNTQGGPPDTNVYKPRPGKFLSKIAHRFRKTESASLTYTPEGGW